MNQPQRVPAQTQRSAADVIAAVVRPEVRALTAYAVAKAEGFIKLDANESPYPLPPALRAKVATAVANVDLNRYPDAGADALRAALRASLGLPAGLGVIFGNGSDELIAIITSTLARPGAVMLVPEPTFVMYRMNALYAGMRYVGVPLNPDFTLDIDATLAAIARESPALIFLASPNNPTANQFAAAHVEAIVRASPGLVVVDEAYGDYTSAGFLARAGMYPNVVVMRTMSKIGMAALRLGYAVAAPEWIAELNKVRPPYNLNALTQATALAVLAEPELLAQQCAAVVAERTRVAGALAALPGVTVFPTQANFLLARVPDATAWSGRLRSAGILVKNFHGGHPLLAQCLRITIGTPTENDALLAALKAIA